MWHDPKYRMQPLLWIIRHTTTIAKVIFTIHAVRQQLFMLLWYKVSA